MFKDILKNLGCTALAALPEPLYNLAHKTLCNVLGLDENCDSKNLANALANATADQIIALKKAESELINIINNYQLESQKLYLANISDARNNNNNFNDKTPLALSVVITAGFFTLLSMLLFYDAKNVTILNIMIGSLGSAFLAIINYYFGSSLGSMKKNEIIANYEGKNANINNKK